MMLRVYTSGHHPILSKVIFHMIKKDMKRFFVLLISVFTLASAQELGFGVFLDTDVRLEPEITLTDLDLSNVKVELRLAGGISSPIEFGAKLRQDSSSGVLGNSRIQAQYDFSTLGGTQFLLQANGVIGPVAANAGWQIFNTLPGAFDFAEAFSDVRPRIAGSGMAFDLGASYRINRTLIASAYPSLYLVSGEGLGLRLNADLRLAKLFDPNDASVLLLGYLEPGDESSFAAFGFEFDFNERSLPPIVASAWLGAGSNGFAPGLRASINQRLPDIKASYGAELGLEPYRTDIMPYRLSGFYEQGLGGGNLRGDVYAALGDDSIGENSVPPLTLKVSYALPF
jgi:hypothetical protein